MTPGPVVAALVITATRYRVGQLAQKIAGIRADNYQEAVTALTWRARHRDIAAP